MPLYDEVNVLDTNGAEVTRPATVQRSATVYLGGRLIPEAGVFFDSVIANGQVGVGFGTIVVDDSTPYEALIALEQAILNVPTTSGDSYTFYDAGNGCFVYASGVGVAFTKDAATGLYTVTVPDGVEVRGGVVVGPRADTDDDNNLFLRLVYEGVRTFNQGLATARVPHCRIIDANTVPSRATPSYEAVGIRTGITAVGSGDIEVILNGAGGAFLQICLIFAIP